MAALLIGYPKIMAGLLPFNAMWQNPASARTKLREDMRKLMSKRAIDLGGMIDKQWIQRD
jgi:hypothetical protein